ncbi:MAG: hypothetical protein GXY03_05725, partial [Solirubrobacterales bacterium]|nr:hypothetical protein [Solirubrobacterales bacterium]
GTFAPKRSGESFWHMFDRWRVIFDQQYLERAWWTGLVEPSIQPVEASDGRLGWEANEPATENSVTKYTSGQEFTVGASVSTEKAAEASVEYTISNETEREIPDWGVSSVTAGNAISWFFSSRNCDPRWGSEGGSGWESSCFDIGFGKPGTPNLPNDLARGQNEFHASARWVTMRDGKEALLTGAEGKLGFRVRSPVQLIDTYCENWGLAACAADKHRIDRDLSGPDVAVYTVDVGDVLPREIESVKLSPNPADGSQADDVTGTVTLDEPVPFETTLSVFSNEDQAVVGTPLSDKVSRARVTIPAGSSTGTFKVQTNDNNLAKGQHITATITVFYAGVPHPQRLCVVTRAGDTCTS